MVVRPRLAHLVAAGLAAPLLTVVTAGVAAAHGAPLDPVSRSAACGSAGRFTQTAACRAARAGSEGQWFEQWDNVRVADVAGRDREIIPDGKLCSGGISGFGGLDLARADWPSTSVRAGRAITVRYRGTIPHQGTFRIYVTKDGFTPKRALRWADLEATPFLTAKDPAFADGAYTFGGRLPSGRTGRHILFTVWQNSSTSDTYYSCSDVVFAKPAGSAATTAAAVAARPSAKPSRTARKSPTRSPSVTAGPSATSTPTAVAGTEVSLAAQNLSNVAAEETSGSLLLPVVTGLGLLALAGTGGGVVLARRRARRQAGRQDPAEL